MSYSFFDKFLHQIVLGSEAVSDLLFDLEQSKLPNGKLDINAKHIYVCGLARAGTTILMKSLYDSGEFASLTYKDMPFILAPNLWARLRKGREQTDELAERSHGDRILINQDSPEALEEVFWRLKLEGAYIEKHTLTAHNVEDSILSDYRSFVSAVLHRYKKSRYLCKNNNNILRLESLFRAFPSALILLPIRDPLQHAISLQNQHKRFTKIHQDDTFQRKYMRWLVHHEFGLDHKAMALSEDESQNQSEGITQIEYWLRQWLNVYGNLAGKIEKYKAQNSSKLHVVDYARLCSEDIKYWNMVRNLCDLEPVKSHDFKAPDRKDVPVVNTKLLSNCMDVYYGLIGQ